MAVEATPEAKPFSDELEGWLQGDQPKTIGSLVELFGEKSFAVLFLLLLAIPGPRADKELRVVLRTHLGQDSPGIPSLESGGRDEELHHGPCLLCIHRSRSSVGVYDRVNARQYTSVFD